MGHTYVNHCSIPWFSLSASFAGLISHGCCDFAFSGMPWDSAGGLDIASAWNGEWFQEQRRVLRRESLKGTGCEWCRKGASLRTPAPIVPPEGMNAEQYANFEAAVRAYQNRDDVVGHFPVSYVFDVGRRCNINCKMCLQKDVLGQDDRPFDVERLLGDSAILAKADTIALYGGEPTFIPAGRALLKALLSDERLKAVRLKLSTNGQLLGDFLPHFPEKERMQVILSVDSYGKAYESIRKGARWPVLEANVRELMRLREARGAAKGSWDVYLNAVMMKSTVAGLDDFSSWCVDEGVMPRFSALFPTRHTHDEDILNNPALLEEVPGWEGLMEGAAGRFETGGFHETAKELRVFLERLRAAVQAGKKGQPASDNARLRNTLDALQQEGALSGKTVMVWGTGSYYDLAVAPELRRRSGLLKHIGFFDNNPARQGGEHDGLPIHGPDKLTELSPDIVVVASWHYHAIRKQLASLGFTGMTL